MANTIKLKRGSGSDPQASDLVVGEVAIRTDNGKLFTKKDNGTIAEISGSGGGAGSDIFINTLSSSSGSGGGSATFNGTATRFTLSNPPDISAQQLLVSINGVIQKPNSGTSPSEGFAIDGADIIFAAAPETGANFFIVTYGTIGLSEPADNSVTSAKIVNGAIVNDDVNTNAAIAGTKISPNFGSQNIITTGDISLNGTNPTISFIDSNENADFRLFINVGKFRIQDVTDSNSDRFIVHTDGHIDIPGNLDVGAGVDVTGNVSVTSGDVSLVGGQTVSWDSSNADLIFNDYAKINLGTDKDFKMYQAGDNTILQSANTSGGVYLQGALVQIGSETGEAGVKYVKDDSVELYFDNSKKLETVSNGISVTGNVILPDSADGNTGRFKSGASADLQMYHDGTNSIIKNSEGDLFVRNHAGGELKLQAKFGEDSIICKPDGAVELLYDAVKKLETTTEGVLVSRTSGTTLYKASVAGNSTIGLEIQKTGSTTQSWRIVDGQTANGKLEFYDVTNSATRMCIDGLGRIGIGTASPSYPIDFRVASGDANMRLRADGTGSGDDTVFRMQVAGTVQDNYIYFGDSEDSNAGYINYNHASNYLRFITNTNERMRIDTLGRVAISTSSISSVNNGSTEAKYFDANDGCRLMSSRASTGAREHHVFFNPNGDVGDITTSGSGTTFNTSSDYRLKENQVLISDGITRLKTLKPYKFNWKVDTSTIVDGFFAHEVSAAVPEAVTGEKDATENCSNVVLDKDGKFLEKDVTEEQWNKGKAEDPATYPSDSTWSASYTKNVYQKIDHSKLVPLLTAALQEAIGKIETLETKVAALEAG